MDLCNEPEVLRAFYIIKIIITYIQVLVPILLILVGIKSFYNYLVDEKGNLKEIVRSFIIKIIIAMLIIFIPVLVNGFIKFVNLKDTTYDLCLLNANEEGISKAYTKKAKDYIVQAKRKLTRAMYRQALLYAEHVDDIKEYNNMQKELEKVDGYVDIAEKINTLTMKNYSKLYSELEKDIKGVSEEEVRVPIKVTAAAVVAALVPLPAVSTAISIFLDNSSTLEPFFSRILSSDIPSCAFRFL